MCYSEGPPRTAEAVKGKAVVVRTLLFVFRGYVYLCNML